MRIWYQTMSAYRYNPQEDVYGVALEELCRQAARPDTEIYITGVPLYQEGLAKYKYIGYYHKSQCLSNMLKAEKEGYDAFVIGCSEDPGLVEGRGMVNIPVVGISQANMYVAAMLGELFAIITSPQGLAEAYRQLVRQYGLREKYLHGNYHLDITEREIKSVKDPVPLADKFKEIAKRAVADGASVIIPIPACIFNLFQRTGLPSLDGATILNPVATVIKVAELSVELKKLGIDVSRKFHVYAYPGRQVVEKTLEIYTPLFKSCI